MTKMQSVPRLDVTCFRLSNVCRQQVIFYRNRGCSRRVGVQRLAVVQFFIVRIFASVCFTDRCMQLPEDFIANKEDWTSHIAYGLQVHVALDP